jgi:hypothetical protein
MARAPYRNPAQRLRSAVDSLPERTKVAMLRGIEGNRIIVGAYVDPRSGGICPMLAAHRNGGRTSLATFAVAWDCYTGAKRPRLAKRREVATLVSLLRASLSEAAIDPAGGSIAEAARTIRAERAEFAALEAREAAADFQPPEPADEEPRVSRRRQSAERAADLRDRLRFAWMKPRGRADDFTDLVSAAEAELSRTVAGETPEAAQPAHTR